MTSAKTTPVKSDTTAPAAPATVKLCGHGVNTSKGTRPCIKPQGHDVVDALIAEHGKGHASRNYKGRGEYKTPNKSTFATLEFVPDDEKVEYGAGRGASTAERSEEQQAVDAQVKRVHEAWIKAGKPTVFNDAPRARYWINPDEEDGTRSMLRSAARLHGVSVRIAPIKRADNGKFMIYWTVMDLNQHEKNGANATS